MPSARKTAARSDRKIEKAAAGPVKKPGAATLSKRRKKPASSALDTQCSVIAHALEDNKAEDIVQLDLKEKCSFADRMLVASGRSQRHVSSLADHVAEALKKAGMPPLSVEGRDGSDWVLIDAGDVVVHIFRPEVRQFYNIEKMWAIAAPTA